MGVRNHSNDKKSINSNCRYNFKNVWCKTCHYFPNISVRLGIGPKRINTNTDLVIKNIKAFVRCMKNVPENGLRQFSNLHAYWYQFFRKLIIKTFSYRFFFSPIEKCTLHSLDDRFIN
jgi:hypothetical protein